MKKRFYLAITFIFTIHVTFAQTREEKAAINFESYFTFLKNDTSNYRNNTIFKDYSELWERKGIPEELKLMIEYDASNFYGLYLNHMKTSRDTVIIISGLNFSQIVKDNYSKFKMSIFQGEKSGKFNYKLDKEYSEKLKLSVNQAAPPVIGYYQTTTMIIKLPNGKTEENKIIINFDKDLTVLYFENLEK